jgi:hypothetical protein
LKELSSIEIAAYQPINDIFAALNKKQIVGGMVFDLEKAFDYFNNDILLSKMKYYGIRGVMYTLI